MHGHGACNRPTRRPTSRQPPAPHLPLDGIQVHILAPPHSAHQRPHNVGQRAHASLAGGGGRRVQVEAGWRLTAWAGSPAATAAAAAAPAAALLGTGQGGSRAGSTGVPPTPNPASHLGRVHLRRALLPAGRPAAAAAAAWRRRLGACHGCTPARSAAARITCTRCRWSIGGPAGAQESARVTGGSARSVWRAWRQCSLINGCRATARSAVGPC